MLFLLSIRDRGDFPRWHLKLELELCFVIVGRTEGVGRAGASSVLTLLALLGRDAGHARERNGLLLGSVVMGHTGAGWSTGGLHAETVRGRNEGASWAGSRFRLNFD
jgi:hypothetical protein